MSESKLVLKKYLLSRVGDSYVLLQKHPANGKEICVIKKKGGSIDSQFKAAVDDQVANSNVRLSYSDSSLRLEADREEQFAFLLKC